MEALLKKLLELNAGRNKRLENSLERIKQLWEHGFNVSYVDVVSAVYTDLVSPKIKNDLEFEDWEKRIVEEAGAYADAVKKDTIQRKISDFYFTVLRE